MITVKLMGGLGNQIFQLAYGISLKHVGYHVRYDKSALREGTAREYSLGYFGVEAGEFPPTPEVYERTLRYNPEYLAPPENSTMIGYWQSEKYFLSASGKVRAALKFKTPRSIQPRVALHVRRQDYVGLQHFHGMPSLNYYREAVAHIRREVGMVPVLVFSDDHSWCRENLPNFPIYEGEDKYDDLQEMASCEYAVIANSSFSWWGAWLGPQKLVVAPKKWFADPSVDSTDIIPDRWVKI